MKNLLAIIILCCVLVNQQAWGQKKDKIRIYQVWLVTEDPKNTVKGYLYELKDSSIVLSNRIHYEPGYAPSYREFQISEIKKLKFRRKGSVGRGILTGAGRGAVTGAVLGLFMGLSVDEGSFFSGFPITTWMGVTALGIAPIGAVTGGLLGSNKIKVPINSEQRNYNYYKRDLLIYQVKH